jgi:hypothetical protein
VRRLLAVQARVALDVIDANRCTERARAVTADRGKDVGCAARQGTAPCDGNEPAVRGDGRRRVAAARDSQLDRTSRPGHRREPPETRYSQNQQPDGRT